MSGFFHRAKGAVLRRILRILGRCVPTLYNAYSQTRYGFRTDRRLEIGPGDRRIQSFETMSVEGGDVVDFVGDAGRNLPFPDGTFQIIYASHILEHIPWYKTREALSEWVRCLAPGGQLEIWVPDGLKICKAFVEAELMGLSPFDHDPWQQFNPGKDPCLWASGRLFTWGDGTGNSTHWNWHRALFSERCLGKLLSDCGLVKVHRLDRSKVRGYDHGWINLGMAGQKARNAE